MMAGSTVPRAGRPAVFLDRDGTLIDEVEGGFLRTTRDLTLYPWSAGAVKRINDAGLLAVVVTNQSGVARGYFDEAFLDEAHRVLNAQLAGSAAHIDAFYYCPHHPDAVLDRYRVACQCRKPEPGLLLRAAREVGVDLDRSWMVGDTWRDVEAGCRAGVRSLLVMSGQGREAAANPPGNVAVEAIVEDVEKAVEWIVHNRE